LERGPSRRAAAFPRRKLTSGSASSKLEAQKRQQAAALQSASRQQHFAGEVPENAQLLVRAALGQFAGFSSCLAHSRECIGAEA